MQATHMKPNWFRLGLAVLAGVAMSLPYGCSRTATCTSCAPMVPAATAPVTPAPTNAAVPTPPAPAAVTAAKPEDEAPYFDLSPLPGEGWQSLFDGKSLDGWSVTEFAGHGEVAVRDGQLVLGMGAILTGVNLVRIGHRLMGRIADIGCFWRSRGIKEEDKVNWNACQQDVSGQTDRRSITDGEPSHL